MTNETKQAAQTYACNAEYSGKRHITIAEEAFSAGMEYQKQLMTQAESELHTEGLRNRHA